MELQPETLRSITHDMRNLLTAVRGHAELALRGVSSDDPAREDIAHVVVVTATIFELIDQIDGSDRQRPQVAVDLDQSVSSMRRLLDALLPRSLELIVHADSEGARVGIPKLRIERIVLNLALNARDAMEEDGGTLSIRTDRPSEETARVIVSDTGPGFSEEALEHLFELGFTTKGDRGSGNGLAALAPFVKGVGGSIEVDSVPGEGATVTVTLPVAQPRDPLEGAIPG